MPSQPRVLLVIPARYGSTRLPAKALADIHGKPMVQWVYERALPTRGTVGTVVATDDTRILERVQGFGGRAVMTSVELGSGTERVAAVAELPEYKDVEVFVNIQGDEPLIQAFAIERAIELVASGRFEMGTVMTPLVSYAELSDPSVVKVIADQGGRSIYFSRHPIPYSRGERPKDGGPYACQRHIGLYVYRRDTLARITRLPPSPLERGEVLEQLRALEAGVAIGIAEVAMTSIGVDTPEDLEKVKAHLV